MRRDKESFRKVVDELAANQKQNNVLMQELHTLFHHMQERLLPVPQIRSAPSAIDAVSEPARAPSSQPKRSSPKRNPTTNAVKKSSGRKPAAKTPKKPEDSGGNLFATYTPTFHRFAKRLSRR